MTHYLVAMGVAVPVYDHITPDTGRADVVGQEGPKLLELYSLENAKVTLRKRANDQRKEEADREALELYRAWEQTQADLPASSNDRVAQYLEAHRWEAPPRHLQRIRELFKAGKL